MSQRTRTRPASATANPAPTMAKTTRKPKATPAIPEPVPSATPEPAGDTPRGLLSAAELARALRAVAEEVERDPALARRVGEAIRGEGSDGPLPRARHTPLPPQGEGQGVGPPSGPEVGEHTPADHSLNLAPSPKAGGERGQIDGAPPTSDMAPPPRHGEGAGGRGSRSFTPRLITGTAPELGAGVPDPFALRARLGEEGLRAALDELRLGTLRAMLREHGLDPNGRLAGVNDATKLRARILSATARPRREPSAQSTAQSTARPMPPATTAHSSPRRAARATPNRPPSFDTEGEDPV